MDIRLSSLSYSSLLTIHSCQRKYQLSRLNAKAIESEDTTQSVTFAFGHIVGLGIQEYITHHSESKAIWQMFLTWEPDLLDDNPKQNKSFWLGVSALQRLIHMSENGFMSDWELCSYQGKPATELSFIINFPDGFSYKGFVDGVLQNKQTGEVMVLECKTSSSSTLNASSYKNSFQAIGYSIVLDALFPTLSSYTVQYLIYKTKQTEYEVMQFDKSYLDRALWIRSLLLDIETIKMYEAAEIYPQHGESCNQFFRECEYYGICSLPTEKLVTELSEDERKEIERRNAEDFQVTLSINDLIEAQLGKE